MPNGTYKRKLNRFIFKLSKGEIMKNNVAITFVSLISLVSITSLISMVCLPLFC